MGKIVWTNHPLVKENKALQTYERRDRGGVRRIFFTNKIICHKKVKSVRKKVQKFDLLCNRSLKVAESTLHRGPSEGQRSESSIA